MRRAWSGQFILLRFDITRTQIMLRHASVVFPFVGGWELSFCWKTEAFGVRTSFGRNDNNETPSCPRASCNSYRRWSVTRDAVPSFNDPQRQSDTCSDLNNTDYKSLFVYVVALDTKAVGCLRSCEFYGVHPLPLFPPDACSDGRRR